MHRRWLTTTTVDRRSPSNLHGGALVENCDSSTSHSGATANWRWRVVAIQRLWRSSSSMVVQFEYYFSNPKGFSRARCFFQKCPCAVQILNSRFMFTISDFIIQTILMYNQSSDSLTIQQFWVLLLKTTKKLSKKW